MKYRAKRVKKEVRNPKSKMGGHGECPLSNGFYPNGLVLEEATLVTRSLDPGRWAKAEERTAELISHIQPNWTSEKHRNAVESYVKRLISNCVPCQVFTFGSVPLKTYLPDGDIDLTAFSEDENLKDNWAKEVRDMLQREENNEHAEFPVKEVQYIQAEVKLIKCLVDNIVVDISFNQLGGLCTLCFLEEVDNLINQNHLFKRSVILIKAWCYYESRILGAHHGLISTYALETLVLYIFHVFNNSFAGPLEVLYRFLEFFSKFDWANFCVSLWGPVPIRSLPSMAADPPRRDGGELLLNKMFLNACGTAYSVAPGGQENQEQPFVSKHFNVVDPLRLNNNLGRSVSKGNFYRIRSAFSFGAEQLARILECQEEDIVAELNQFFVNTWGRHGSGCRPDAPILDASHFKQVESGHDGKLRRRKVAEKSTENFTNQIARTTSRASKQKEYEESKSQMASSCDNYQSERMKLRKKQQNDIERTCRLNILQNIGHATSQFARTSSSPELTSMSSKAVSICRDNVARERVEDDAGSRSENTRRIRASGTMENHVPNCLTGESPIRESSICHSIASNSDDSFGSHVSKSFGSSMKPVFSSDSEASQRRQQEQESMNLKSSSGKQNLGGHVQMPVNLSAYPSVPILPANRGYGSQSYACTIPANLSAVDSDWGTSRHSSDGPVLASFHKKISSVRVRPEGEEMIGGLNGGAESLEVDHLGEDSCFWADYNSHPRKEIDPESEDFSTASSRISPASPAASSRTKASSESSWDGKPSQIKNAMRYPSKKKTVHLMNPTTTVYSRRQEDGRSICSDDQHKDSTPLSIAESGSSVTSSHVELHQMPGYGQAHMSYQNSLPFGSLVVRPSSEQGVTHNHAVVPVAIYSPGSYPYVTMMPIYNLPAERGTSGAATSHFDVETQKSTYPMNQSGYYSDSAKELEQMSHSDNNDSAKSIASAERSEECGSDIFNSDFACHWQNLQFGRRCQNSHLRHPFVYPPPVLVPPLPLQGHFPFDAPQSPLPGSPGVFPHLVPVSPPQHVSDKPAGISRQYGGEVSKQRNGTGTYFPNPEIIKGRQISTSRQFRGDYNDDRNEPHRDREPTWNFNSKPRISGRDQPRYHEKPNSKIDWSTSSGSQNDRPRDTFRQSTNQLYRVPKGPLPAKPMRNGPDDGEFSVYPVRPAHHDEVSSSGDTLPPLVMLCPYPQTFTYGSWTEQLRFGSIGPELFVGTDELSRYSKGGDQELQNYQGLTGPPTPDYASPRFPSGVI